MLASLFQPLIDLIKLIWHVLYVFLPFKMTIVQKGEMGTRFTFGQPGPNLAQGIHFATSGQALKRRHAVLNVAWIDEIRITLQDGTPIWATGIFTYRIRDLGRFLTNSEDSEMLISELVEAATKHILSQSTFEKVQARTAEEQIHKEAHGLCSDAGIGVELKTFRLKDLQVCHPALQAAHGAKLLGDAVAALVARFPYMPLSAVVGLLTGAQNVIPIDTPDIVIPTQNGAST